MPRHSLGQDRSTSRGSTRELSWSAFERYVQELARTLRRRFEPDAIIGVAHGGVFVGGALASALQKEFFPVRISRRSRDRGAPETSGKQKGRAEKDSATPRLIGSMPEEIRGLRVLIVDDIASSGDTLELATSLAVKAGARATATAALVARPNGFDPDFRGMTTDELVVFPWDYQGFLPDSNFDDGSPPAPSRRIRQPLMASPNLDEDPES